MAATLEQIEAQVRAYNPDADLTGLDAAYAFAVSAHEGQTRSGKAVCESPHQLPSFWPSFIWIRPR
jgi:(p)ppGpp synthase/HD superfamily hydrolase